VRVGEITRRREIKAARQQALLEFLERANRTQTPYPKHETVSRVFHRQATSTPDVPAVIFGQRSLSYRQLDALSDRHAYSLIERALPPERCVGVMLDRSPGAIACLLGTLKAGGAYLPLAPEFPFHRVAQLLRDSRAPVLFAEQSQAEICARLQTECPDLQTVLYVDKAESLEDAGSAGPPVDRSRAGSLAYIMYTSGTTGKPKGVMIEQHAILRLVLRTNWIRLGPEDRILQTGSMSFDASTFEIWGALLNGGALVITNRDTLLSPAKLTRLISRHGVTTIWLTAGLFRALAANHLELFTGLRTVICGGEKVSAHHCNLVRHAHPQISLKNGYGPTENTTFTTVYDICQDFEFDVPIGRPISNSTVYILDDNLQPVDIEKPGELCTGGDGLARGYLNEPILTSEKFIQHPLFGRLYRTGDLARWRPDGCIEYLGREDRQVKIRGFRIEPAEIEAQLLGQLEIKDALVVTRTSYKGETSLAAYYAVHSAIGAAELRSRLSACLPDYMVPAFFQELEAIPLTPNGKVDRSALAEPLRQTRSPSECVEGPPSATEVKLAAIWEEVLDCRPVGVHDNFFALGGHSLTAVKLTYLVQQRLGFTLPFTLIFKAPTVREMAKLMLDAACFGESMIDEPMVCLTPDRTGRPLFGFPPGTADALGYSELARRIGDVSFHAFNFVDSENILDIYVNLIESVDSAGPYVLFGYSGGGNLAFRTAVRLEAKGRVVSDLIMLDSSRFLSRYRFPADEAQRLAKEFLAHDSVSRYAHSQLLKDKVVFTIQRYYDFLSGAEDAATVGANIHLITSGQSPDEFRDESGRLVCSKSAWEQATRGRFRRQRGHGEHGHMLHIPFLDANAALVQQALFRDSRGG
jgi:fengycin family lipopeptide synthetase E